VRYLLDTDTLIYWLKGDNDIDAKALAAGLDQLALSIITKAELYFGAYHSVQISQNLAAIAKLTQTLTIMPFDDVVADRFGALKAELKQRGSLILDADMMIAATALTNNLILVTNNQKHFGRIKGLRVANWRQASR
jgi:tRNA(fMet)-specific endonuclease VapC